MCAALAETVRSWEASCFVLVNDYKPCLLRRNQETVMIVINSLAYHFPMRFSYKSNLTDQSECNFHYSAKYILSLLFPPSLYSFVSVRLNKPFSHCTL